MSRAIVVVPCYDEARRLDLPQFQQYGRTADGAELLFVNDGSRDATPELLERLRGEHSRRFQVLHMPRNSGKAEAVREGVRTAIRSGAEYVGYWDADLATPLVDIAAFSRVLDSRPHVELVIGSRMRLLGRDIQRRTSRYYLGRLFARTASLALGMRVFDTQCGAKLFRVTPLLTELFEGPFSTRWIFDVEIMARMKLARRVLGLSALESAMYEFPLDSWRDVAGSSVKAADFSKAAVELARIYWRYLRPGARYIPSVPLAAPSKWLPEAAQGAVGPVSSPASQLTPAAERAARGDQKAA